MASLREFMDTVTPGRKLFLMCLLALFGGGATVAFCVFQVRFLLSAYTHGGI